MLRDKILVVAVFCVAVGVAISLNFLRQGNVDAAPVPGASDYKPLAIDQIRGVCLQVQSGDDNHPYDKYIKEIAATGANTVMLVVTAFQQNCGSSSMFIEVRKTPSQRRLKEIIDLAHKEGLKVCLMPIVLLENPRDGEWRGKIDPTKETPKNSWEDWWANYTNYILHYAYLANETKVDIFMVGSELVSTESDTARWEGLIKKVRERYSGYLSYSANWDHYEPIKWWDKLDIVGMTTYYDLCGDAKPSMEVLMEHWGKTKKKILDWQAKINRPILFTEVGWPNQISAAQYPWDYYRSQDKPAPELQKMCFESFFKTWADEKAVGGYLIWEWQNYEGQDTSPQATDYVPKGKPAMDLISKYFRLPNGNVKTASRPAASQPVTSLPATAEPVVEATAD